MTARMEWSAETGLPLEMFEASKEELAAIYFNERAKLATILDGRDRLMKDGTDEPALLKDALAFYDATAKTQAKYVVLIKAEWERKQ